MILQKRLRIFVLALDMNFFKSVFWFFVIGVVFACSPAQKQVLIPVNDFFKSQDKATYRISPDGKSISYLKLQDQKQNLFVENISTGEIVQLTKLMLEVIEILKKIKVSIKSENGSAIKEYTLTFWSLYS